MSVDTWIERIGATSVTLLQTIRANGEVAADVRSVVVAYDYAAKRPKPWTPDQRQALEAYVHP